MFMIMIPYVSEHTGASIRPRCDQVIIQQQLDCADDRADAVGPQLKILETFFDL